MVDDPMTGRPKILVDELGSQLLLLMVVVVFPVDDPVANDRRKADPFLTLVTLP
jgi:hypothetical protein